jgi:hypothetical protein
MADDSLVDTLQKIRDVPGKIVDYAKNVLGGSSTSNGDNEASGKYMDAASKYYVDKAAKDSPPAKTPPKPPPAVAAKPNSMKHGGTVEKTGLALVHKGEEVVPAEKNPVSIHRALHHLNKGGLHKALGVNPSSEIPADKLAAAKGSPNGHVATMAHLHGALGSTPAATPAAAPAAKEAIPTGGTGAASNSPTSATKNSGAATGGAVTITMSPSSTSTSTGSSGPGSSSGTGSGKDAGEKGGKEAEKHQHVHIKVDARGMSGHANGTT